jgi:hypothetical protein
VPCHGQGQSLVLTLPPLATIYLRLKPEKTKAHKALTNKVQEDSSHA